MKYLLFTFGLIVLLISCNGNNSKEKSIKFKKTLYLFAQDSVINKLHLDTVLNSPDNILDYVRYSSPVYIEVNSWITSKNKFGSKVQYDYICNIKLEPDTFHIEDLDIKKFIIKKSKEEIEYDKKISIQKKKQLKSLRVHSFVKYDKISLRATKIWIGKNWNFDDYGYQYFSRSAKRGYKFILARVSISSKINDPVLPPVMIYQLKGYNLHYIGTLGYKFRRWKDYGAYLGNYLDYGNDFDYSKTVYFNMGIELSEKEIKSNYIYVIMKKEGCFEEHYDRYDNPPIRYEQGRCNIKDTLDIDDLKNDYSVLKIFKKGR